MYFSRKDHFNFLESELKAQTSAFKQKLDTAAQYLLLKRGEMFVSQYLNFKDGEMILKFSSKRSLPRKGDFLYCMILPKQLRSYRNWGQQTYGELIKQKAYHTEVVCVWHSKCDEEGYNIAGFRGVDIDFADVIKDNKGIILVLGPNKPPYEYITNLQDIVINKSDDNRSILDNDYIAHSYEPILLDNNKSISTFILRQINLFPTLILQGPPGTGKTFMIAELCAELCNQGKSVLVTALTNRALMEIVNKDVLEKMLNDGKIFKTNLKTDEQQEQPKLQKINDFSPIKGSLLLSTYYVTSGSVKSYEPLFDYVIMDEASQALLAMFEVSKRLGIHNIWIGDTKQLPPVVQISDDKIKKRGYTELAEGLRTISECSNIPIYQLTTTYRLSERAADFTKIFYKGNYYAKNKIVDLGLKSSSCSNLLHPEGGPTLIKSDFPIGEVTPKAALLLTSVILKQLYEINNNLSIAVLSCMVETAKGLQKAILQIVGNHNKLIIDTVAKVQGITTDITIFVIPNSVTFRSLELRLFNVATSRAKAYTLIIVDKNILSYRMSSEVRSYLQKLNNEFSFYFPFSENVRIKGNISSNL